jgi:hypothetical protein
MPERHGAENPTMEAHVFDPTRACVESRFRSPNLHLLDLTMVAAKAAPAGGLLL